MPECTHQLRILSHATKIHHKRLFEDENLYMQKMFKSLTNVAKKGEIYCSCCFIIKLDDKK